MARQLKIDHQRYSLCSVVIQRGHARAGHYWSICRHTVNQEDTWWVYNDAEELRVATESDIDAPSDRAGAAHSYIAFYVQANEGMLDLGSGAHQLAIRFNSDSKLPTSVACTAIHFLVDLYTVGKLIVGRGRY